MCLLSLSHLDKKPQHQNSQKPSRTSTDPQRQVWQVSSAKVASDEAHQRGRHPFGKKGTVPKACFVFTGEDGGMGQRSRIGSHEGRRGGEGRRNKRAVGRED